MVACYAVLGLILSFLSHVPRVTCVGILLLSYLTLFGQGFTVGYGGVQLDTLEIIGGGSPVGRVCHQARSGAASGTCGSTSHRPTQAVQRGSPLNHSTRAFVMANGAPGENEGSSPSSGPKHVTSTDASLASHTTMLMRRPVLPLAAS